MSTSATLSLPRHLLDSEDRPRIARCLEGGSPLGLADVVQRLDMEDGSYLLLPLFVDWRKAAVPLSEFWAVYPRTLIDGDRQFVFLGTHATDGVVLYRAAP